MPQVFCAASLVRRTDQGDVYDALFGRKYIHPCDTHCIADVCCRLPGYVSRAAS
jgi:hypothetical protein